MWDEAFKGTNLTITNQNRTVFKRTDDEYETVLATTALTSGRHRWEIKIDNYVSDEDIFIGVA